MSRSHDTSAAPRIIIARHGEPDADRRERLDWRGYERWWAGYDEAGLRAGATRLYASTLPRAIETAQAAAPERELILDSMFVEAPLPPPQIPGRFTARTWGVFARCSWWLGHSRGRETRGQAERRAEQAADQLIEASREGTVALFAHGWFNRMLRPALARRGWRCVRDGGDWYWSWRAYTLKNPR